MNWSQGQLHDTAAAADKAHRFRVESFDELYQRFPEQYVAVLEGEVVGANRDPFALRKQLDEHGVDQTGVSFKLLTRKRSRLGRQGR